MEVLRFLFVVRKMITSLSLIDLCVHYFVEKVDRFGHICRIRRNIERMAIAFGKVA